MNEVASSLQQFADETADIGVIVDDEHGGHRALQYRRDRLTSVKFAPSEVPAVTPPRDSRPLIPLSYEIHPCFVQGLPKPGPWRASPLFELCSRSSRARSSRSLHLQPLWPRPR